MTDPSTLVPFFKMSGSGNDFVALVEPASVPSAALIRDWCRRGLSLGADGLFVLRRAPAAAGQVLMDYWNADGKPAELCLNGTRCAAQLAFHLGWAADVAVVQTASGPTVARPLPDSRIALEIPAPGMPEALSVEHDGQRWDGWRIIVGVPHFVLPWNGALAEAPVGALGAALRHHRLFAPAGTNVNFVRFPQPGLIELRTYERGVEDETLACGSGAVASAAVGRALGLSTLPVAVATRGGCQLEVAIRDGRWELAGEARLVARGEIFAAGGRC